MGFVELTATRIRLLEVSVPLRVPFAISGGTLTHRRSLVVELATEDGAKGYGEAAPFEAPFYSAETTSSVAACLREILVPRLWKTPIDSPAELHRLLTADVRGNHMARASLDTAWWDLQARVQDVSLARLIDARLESLGVRPPLRSGSFMTCGAALGIPQDERVSELRAAVVDAVGRGFARIKLKVRPGWTEVPVRETQDELTRLGAQVSVTVDGNGAFRWPDNLDELEALDQSGLAFIEQPFPDDALWDSVAWNRSARTPLCLDESLTGDDVARQVLDMQGPAIWNLKVQRLGGLEETCRVYARGLAGGAAMWVGTMPETGLGASAALALGGLEGLRYDSDLAPSDWWFRNGSDLVPIRMTETGALAVPDRVPLEPRLDGVKVLKIWP